MAGSIREVRIECAESYPVDYYALPPTISFPVEIFLGPRTANERIVVGGAVGHEADEWKRPIIGEIILEPYLTFFSLTIPLYVAIAPHEEALIRIPFERCDPSNPTKSRMRPQREVDDFQDEFGTKVMLRLANDSTVSFVHGDSILAQLYHVLSPEWSSELQTRLQRRWR
jgi:hypothetical protein